jgi:alanyl-tRNA synthetase
MTERLYYTDSYAREFAARVIDRSDDGLTVYLDRTAFYPSSGGQPHDTGAIAGVPVVDVVDEGERIAHRTAAPLHTGPVDCAIDWKRRFDHMQQHTGQHLLSAVFAEYFGRNTVSFHLGQEGSTIDLEGGPVEPRTLVEVEQRANEIVFQNRPVGVRFDEAASTAGLRKAAEREGTLRIVSIEDLDRSACGGTHVRATGEIGPILIRKLDKVRNTVRVEFLCGTRAVRRARSDYDALARMAQGLSAPLDEVPSLVAAQLETARASDKLRRKLEVELAGYRGRELYSGTTPDGSGKRWVVRRVPSGGMEELRALAQSFTAGAHALFFAALDEPPSVLVASSADSGVDASGLVKEAVSRFGGRGGGNARMAQASVPARELLDPVLAAFRALIEGQPLPGSESNPPGGR